MMMMPAVAIVSFRPRKAFMPSWSPFECRSRPTMHANPPRTKLSSLYGGCVLRIVSATIAINTDGEVEPAQLPTT